MARSVLIIDDDPSFRALARRVLGEAGLDVLGEAETAAIGVTMAGNLRPDMLLVDVGLPDRNGVDLVRELSQLDWGPRIVLTSVDADATTDHAARAAGALGFVPKHELPGDGLDRLLDGA